MSKSKKTTAQSNLKIEEEAVKPVIEEVSSFRAENEKLKAEIAAMKKELEENNKPVRSIHDKIEIIGEDEDEQYKEESRMVPGIFRYYEIEGGILKFSYRKYKRDGIKNYEFKDGERYTIPLHVAKHLNNTGWYAVHVNATDKEGNQTERIGSKIHRYGFNSLEFIEGLEQPSRVVEQAVVVK